jgi:thioredoxin-related protein
MVIAIVAGLFLAPRPLQPAACKPNEKIAWLDYNKAMLEAKRQNKPVILFFYTSHCRYCEMLKQNGFNQPDIACYVNQNLIAISVNGDVEEELRETYSVTDSPTVWFLTPKGNNIDYFIGYVEPQDLALILHYIGDKAYETKSYDRFVKEQKRNKRPPT